MQSKSTRFNKQMSVFVICEPDSNIWLLLEAIQELGLKPLNFSDEPSLETQVSDISQKLIRKADFVCVVLSENVSPNVYLELGFAQGLGKPAVIISDAVDAPLAISGLFQIRASITNPKAIAFHLGAFVENLDSYKAKRTRKKTQRPKTVEVSQKLIGRGPPQSELESRLLDALLASPEIKSVVPQPIIDEERRYIPDFAVWISGAFNFINAPVLIEVKSLGSSNAQIQNAVEQLKDYVHEAEVNAGVLIVDNPKHPLPKLVSLSPLIFAIDLHEALQMLQSGSLFKDLYHERNLAVHSARRDG